MNNFFFLKELLHNIEEYNLIIIMILNIYIYLIFFKCFFFFLNTLIHSNK